MKFSIIVPVYNVEGYVKQCIESILSQTYNDYELLIVDDGSTDNSGSICDAFLKNKKVKVFHKKNGGLSSARNYGIKKSSGDYLMFVDGDDFLYSNDCLATLYKILSDNNTDILQYKYVYFFDKKNNYRFIDDIDYSEELGLYDNLHRFVKDGSFSIAACDKIVKREIIIKNNLLFKDGLLSEDIDWSLRLYEKIESMMVCDKNVYAYRQQRSGSITSKNDNKRVDSIFGIINYWYSYDYRNNDDKKRLYLSYLAYQYTILLTISRMSELKRFYSLRGILAYDENYKVKLFNKVTKAFGFMFGIVICKVYLKLKNKGLIRL